MEVINISGFPIEHTFSNTYTKKIGNTEMTVENIHPVFQSKDEKDRVESEIKQSLYEVFAKYHDDC